jgi:hypothetical protein
VTTDGEPSCAEISLRLIGGELPSGDPALQSHVGSCLRCFRTATEMREVPQLAAMLRDGDDDRLADPGPAFWARFPATVSAAWEQREARRHPWRAHWRRLAGWLRQPIAAGLAGAGVASLVLTLISRPVVVHDRVVTPILDDGDLAAVEAMTGGEVMGELTGEDETPWDVLELTDVKGAMAQVDQDATAVAPDDGDLASPAEEVELLDGDELPVVAQAMRGRI